MENRDNMGKLMDLNECVYGYLFFFFYFKSSLWIVPLFYTQLSAGKYRTTPKVYVQ